MSWSVVSGQLPAGMSLSGAGVLSGTPTVAGTARVRLQVTGGNGRSSRRFLSVQAVQTGTPGWGAYGRDGSEPVRALGADHRRRHGPDTGLPMEDGGARHVDNELQRPGHRGQPPLRGRRRWRAARLGHHRIDHQQGTGLERAPRHGRRSGHGVHVDAGRRRHAADRVGPGRLPERPEHVDGAPLWRVAADVSTYPFKGVLVTGTTILGITQTGGVKAYSVTDGSPCGAGRKLALRRTSTRPR